MRRVAGLVVSCEHATNHVPARYRRLFKNKERLLASHRGWDPGTLELGSRLARRYRAPLVAAEVTRLLVECNRSLRHRRLFSNVTRSLPQHEREKIVERFYTPHRDRVERAIREAISERRMAVHVSVHSFTPVLRGVVRRADIGLLYDPHRPIERDIARRWRHSLHSLDPGLRVWLNYPYRGWTDGVTTSMRKRFAAAHYAGLELEINQRIVRGPRKRWLRLQASLVESVSEVVRS